MVSFTFLAALLASSALASPAPTNDLVNRPKIEKTGANSYTFTYTQQSDGTLLHKRADNVVCFKNDRPNYNWKFFDDMWGYRDSFCQWIHNPSHPFDGDRGNATLAYRTNGKITHTEPALVWWAPKQKGGYYISTYKPKSVTKDECIASFDKIRRCEFGGDYYPGEQYKLHGYGFWYAK